MIVEAHGSGRPLLVGVDGSKASYKAVWWAANYAKHSGLELDIIVAYSLPSYAAVSFDTKYSELGDDNAAHADAQEILSKAKAIAIEQGLEEETVKTMIVTGDPSSVLVELSRNYDLIVIGNRGKGGLAERLLGTTSSTLPAYAYCPVVVVPFADDDGDIVHLPSSISRVAVGSDDSRWGARALDIAADIAAGWNADLSVVSVVSLPRGVSKTDEQHMIEDLEEQQSVKIGKMKDQWPGLNVESHVIAGPACNALIEEDADLIVVGSRGRGGLTGLLFGSVSQDLIQHSYAPVYVVPRRFVEREEWKSDAYADVAEKPIDNGGKAIVSNESGKTIAVETYVEPAVNKIDEINKAIDPVFSEPIDFDAELSASTPTAVNRRKDEQSGASQNNETNDD